MKSKQEEPKLFSVKIIRREDGYVINDMCSYWELHEGFLLLVRPDGSRAKYDLGAYGIAGGVHNGIKRVK